MESPAAANDLKLNIKKTEFIELGPQVKVNESVLHCLGDIQQSPS